MPCRPFPDPVFPISAEQITTNQVEVVFSRDLAAGMLDAGNWLARAGITPVAAASAEATGGSVVVITLVSAGAFASVSYSPPPFDVVGAGDGTPADAFDDFPVG